MGPPNRPSRHGRSLALHVERKPSGIVVFLRGECGQGDLELVDRVLEDLLDGQGNRAVTVEAAGLRPGESEELDRVARVARARGAHFTRDERTYRPSKG